MNLHENPEENLVTATFELPGLTKDKVNIDVHHGNLTISGGVSESSERDEHPYVVRERRSGRFSRTIKLPEGTEVSLPFLGVGPYGPSMLTNVVLAQGSQGVDGTWHLDGYLPQELSRHGASAHLDRLGSGDVKFSGPMLALNPKLDWYLELSPCTNVVTTSSEAQMSFPLLSNITPVPVVVGFAKWEYVFL